MDEQFAGKYKLTCREGKNYELLICETDKSEEYIMAEKTNANIGFEKQLSFIRITYTRFRREIN